MKYYFIAGEQSGDMHGANLMVSLVDCDTRAQFRGFGGDNMHRAGLDLVTHHSEISFMGTVGLLIHLRKIYTKIKQCKKDILAYQPHVVILIDYGGFNMRIAQFCKKKRIKVFYYISPKIWAWGEFRANVLKKHVDHMFCILPFEKEFYKKFNWEVDYVGNPVFEAVKKFQPDIKFLYKNKLNIKKKIIALLPGSRKNELKKMIPLFIKIISSYPEYQFAVATVNSVPAKMYNPFLTYENTILVAEATFNLLFHSHVAIVTSGTATLETGLFGVPQMVLYKTTSLEYFFGNLLVNVKYISLINLIANALVVKEYIQNEVTVYNVRKELKELIENTAYRQKIIEQYRYIEEILKKKGFASSNTATLMVNYLQNR